jgi:spermidine synthase
MLPWVVVDQTTTPDGTPLVLSRRGDEWDVSVGRHTLMSSRMHGSEEALAELALASAPRARAVLIGGLGLGYSLRAALDRLPGAARVVVAELSPVVVQWNRTHVAGLAGRPLDDPRVGIELDDVWDVIRRHAGAWDAILLDVDNGPSAMGQSANARLYDAAGIESCHRALRPGGVLAVWSPVQDAAYVRRLRQAGFEASEQRVPARPGARPRHVVFLAVRGRAAPPRPPASGRGRRLRG